MTRIQQYVNYLSLFDRYGINKIRSVMKEVHRLVNVATISPEGLDDDAFNNLFNYMDDQIRNKTDDPYIINELNKMKGIPA